MPERYPVSTPASSRSNPWPRRVLAGAALFAGLGGALKQHSDARHQDELNASAPSRRTPADRERAEGSSPIPGAQSVWDQFWRQRMDVQDDASSPSVPEYQEMSREEAERIGREVYDELVADGELERFRGHYPEFNDEISIRLARRFGRAYSPTEEAFRRARAEIDDALGDEADRLYDVAETHIEQGMAIQAGHEIEASIQTEMLVNPASGINAAVEAGSGRLVVESMRQYHSADTDGPSIWGALIPGDSPRDAAEGLGHAWSWMDAGERQTARARVQAIVGRIDALIEEARVGGVREDDRERVARLPAILAEWERLLARLTP